MAENDMTPVIPDPKKLRRTAFALVVVMVVGGVLILKAYEKRAQESSEDNRPSFLTQISAPKDLIYMRQDGEIKELIALKGKVLVLQSLAKSQPDETVTGAMKALSEKFAEREDVVLVTLMLDPGKSDELGGQLKGLAEELGAELPHWIVASNERPTLHKFIKNEFKANMLPYEEGGEWHYDRSLVLIDKNRHVRRAVVPQKRGGAPFVAAFDFEQAENWDEEGIKTGTELSNVEQLENLLADTIEILLEEKAKP